MSDFSTDSEQPLLMCGKPMIIRG